MSWTTPADLKAQLEKRWARGELLAARLGGESPYPLALRLKRPDNRQLSEHFDEARRWVQALREGSREVRGFGYEIEWGHHNHRVLGSNRLPHGVTVPSEADALRLLGRVREAERFDALCAAALGPFPELRPWIARRPLALLENGEAWPRILAVLEWFRAHPRPGCYLRQVDIPGVDTKFIEGRRALLGELLDAVLPDWAMEQDAVGVRRFHRRYGLREEPPLIRLRILDPRLAIGGVTDLSLPPDQFAALDPPVERAFVTENKTNGLAFPDTPGAVVIFGLGYGLDRLADIPWLQRTELHYWGDIDSHGFAILDRLRSTLPAARSLLMDRATLLAHRELWGVEQPGQRFRGELGRLTEPERALFEALRNDRFGEGVRLEQERIGFDWVCEAVAALSG